MFGYIMPRLNQLDERQRERYRSIYCGLCREMKHSYGQIGRVTLSHDMTFLAVLLNSLDEPKEQTYAFRCPFHPLKKHHVIWSENTHYAAAMNQLLMYYKCQDMIIDDRSLTGQLGEKLLSQTAQTIKNEFPTQYQQITESLEAIWIEEKKKYPNPDQLCNLSGKMLGSVFVQNESSFWAPYLRSLGQGLGRFIYWMDAWDDLDRDRKANCFNPLYTYENRDDFELFTQQVLQMLVGEAAEYFELLPLKKDLDLLRNVLYSGIWQRYEIALARRKRRGSN